MQKLIRQHYKEFYTLTQPHHTALIMVRAQLSIIITKIRGMSMALILAADTVTLIS